jgi:glyoxylase-like metal-dependent hydrolase (beta-lactamase superfamily II)
MTIQVTSPALQSAWRDRVHPPSEVVRPGLWSIPVPIPNNPLRYVLVYVFELGNGVAVVDAGWPDPDAWEAFSAGLAWIGYSVADVRSVLVTHAHADHYGLAPRIRAESGAWIGIHSAELPMLARRDQAEIASGLNKWLRSIGAPPSEAAAMVGGQEDYAQFQFDGPDQLIADGDRPLGDQWDLVAVWTPGHTPGHLCFHLPSSGLFLSGDHVLPRISPNIALYEAGGSASPLDDYLASLRHVGTIPAGEVLPAHEYRFSGLAERAQELIAHHAARLAEIEAALEAAPRATTWELASQLTWSRTWEQTLGFIRRAALGETQAHLVSLERARRAHREHDSGIERWSRLH